MKSQFTRTRPLHTRLPPSGSSVARQQEFSELPMPVFRPHMGQTGQGGDVHAALSIHAGRMVIWVAVSTASPCCPVMQAVAN